MKAYTSRVGHKIIKLVSCSPQLSMKHILLIYVKMPTITGILAFIYFIIIFLREVKFLPYKGDIIMGIISNVTQNRQFIVLSLVVYQFYYMALYHYWM